MKNASLLREYVRLVVEGASAPVELVGPFTRVSYHEDVVAVYREFPVRLTGELAQAMNLCRHSDCRESGNGSLAISCLESSGEATDGVLNVENEVFIVPHVYYTRGTPRRWNDPGDPEEFLVEGYDVVALNNVSLKGHDAEAVRERVGELTDDELEMIRLWWYERNEDDDGREYEPYD